MARRRGRKGRASEAGDSLDLLLDTICNTFGGVLFMALLICLLTSKPRLAVTGSADAQASARSQLSALESQERREREELEADGRAADADRDHAAADATVATLAARLGTSATTVAAMAEALADRGREARDAISSREQLEALAVEAARRRATIAQLEAEAARRRDEIAASEAAAANARDRARVVLRVPSARETAKDQAVAFVSGGRMFGGVYPSEAYRGSAPIYRGCTAAGGDSIAPRDLPDALGSAVIDTPDAARAALASQRLEGVDRNATYVVFAVWPDSHEAFRLLRDALVARGVGYGLILIDKGEAVRFGGGVRYEQ